MCIRDRIVGIRNHGRQGYCGPSVKDPGTNECQGFVHGDPSAIDGPTRQYYGIVPVSYTHLRAHETVLDLVCRLLLEKKKNVHMIDHNAQT